MKRIDLSRLQEKFSGIVESYMAKRQLNQGEIAKECGMQRTHLNALLNGHRPLTAFYVYQFLIAGTMTVDEIYDGKAESSEEEEFWQAARLTDRHDMLKKIAQLEAQGVDVNAVLEALAIKK